MAVSIHPSILFFLIIWGWVVVAAGLAGYSRFPSHQHCFPPPPEEPQGAPRPDGICNSSGSCLRPSYPAHDIWTPHPISLRLSPATVRRNLISVTSVCDHVLLVTTELMTVGKGSKCRQTCWLRVSPRGSDLSYQNGLVQHLVFHRCHPKSPVHLHLRLPATCEQDPQIIELPGLGLSCTKC